MVQRYSTVSHIISMRFVWYLTLQSMGAVGGNSGSFYWDVVRTRIGIIIIMYSLESFAREQVELLKLNFN